MSTAQPERNESGQPNPPASAYSDPTRNVVSLVEAKARADADLRAADLKLMEMQVAHLKEVATLRAANSEILRLSDLDRLAKTREVDVLAGAAQATSLATAVSTLATTSDRNADTLRNLVKDTSDKLAKQNADQASALASQTDAQVKDINNRIAELQKSSYQGAGKSSMADPQMAELVQQVKALALLQQNTSGSHDGSKQVIAYIIAGAGFLVGALGLLLKFLPSGTPTP